MTSSLHFAQLKFWFRLDISRCSGPETLAQVLSSEFCKISRNAFSYGTRLVVTSGFPSIYRLLQVSLVNFKAFSKVAINVTFWLLTIWIKKVELGNDQNLLMNLKAIARWCFQINRLFENPEKFTGKHHHQRLLFINCRLILQLY